jgi:hypothetical protein
MAGPAAKRLEQIEAQEELVVHQQFPASVELAEKAPLAWSVFVN